LENIIFLRKVTLIYDRDEVYLYEILDDYREADDKKKKKIFKSFCSSIWSCDNKRRVFNRDIKFSVDSRYLKTEIGEIFNSWSSISYITYKSMSKELDYASLIRQKVNNIYCIMFDKDVCQRKDYMKLIKTPKTLYFRWIKGEEYESEALTNTIDDAMSQAVSLKEKYSMQKLDLSWIEYKSLIETCFLRIFNNCIGLDDYEDKSKITVQTEVWHEDNFYISYFCKMLDGYLRNYQKKYYGLYVPGSRNKYILKRCTKCGSLYNQKKRNQKLCQKCAIYQPIGTKTIKCIDCDKEIEINGNVNRKRRCDDCQHKKQLEFQRKSMKKIRVK